MQSSSVNFLTTANDHFNTDYTLERWGRSDADRALGRKTAKIPFPRPTKSAVGPVKISRLGGLVIESGRGQVAASRFINFAASPGLPAAAPKRTEAGARGAAN